MASTYAIYFICALSAIVLDSFYSHVAILMICFFGYMVFLMSHKRVNRLLKNKMMQNLHFSSIGIAASFALFYGASSAIYPIVFAMLIFIQQLRIYQSYMKSIFMELGAMKRKLNGLEAARLQKNTFPSEKSPAKLVG